MLIRRVVEQLLCITCVLGYSYTPIQYHIQTDVGPDRYFRYQNFDGQYRKEKRLDDGTVFGTYGWVDDTGILRLTDYIADTGGYRVVRNRKIKVNRPVGNQKQNSINTSDKYAHPVRLPSRKKISFKKKMLSSTYSPALVNLNSPTYANIHLPSSHSRQRLPLKKTSSTFYNHTNNDSVQSVRNSIIVPIKVLNNFPFKSSELPDRKLLFPNYSETKILSSAEKIPLSNNFGTKILSSGEKIISESKDPEDKYVKTTEYFNTKTEASEVTTQYPYDTTPSDSEVSTPKLKFRPLVIRRRKNPAHLSLSKRRRNYKSVRQRVKSDRTPGAEAECCADRIELRGKATVQRIAPSVALRSDDTSRNSVAKGLKLISSATHKISEFDSLKGRVTIDFDLGNQYRKEKILPDGSIIGEHGYVDPMGILRITTYKSGGGSGGLQQRTRSF